MAFAFALLAAFTWLTALPGHRYDFPRDHFNHPGFRTEWWYYTGNLRAESGHRYGIELVFFRQGRRRGPSDNPSAWRADDLYLAHLALTDIDGRRFLYITRLNRAGPGIAGADFAQARIWNGNWQSQWDLASGSQTLSAVAEGIRFTLHLTPGPGGAPPPIINGENGVSQKAAGPGKASYYVSFPRLEAAGTLNGRRVQGLMWMDHEWFTHPLESYQRGWDWFCAQLDDGSGLMLFQIRDSGGGIDPFSAGTYIARNGRATHLKRSDFRLDPIAYWTSPKTGARYPVRWRIAVPSLHIALDCAAALDQQEIVPEESVGPAYWEGAVRYSGSGNGVGYLEMTGYAEPLRL